MDDSDLIDVDLIHFPNSQTWSFDDEYHARENAEEDMDVVEWSLACAGSAEDAKDEELRQLQQRLFQLLDTMMDKEPEPLSERGTDKHKFNSRTYVKPRRRGGRAPLHSHAPAHTHALAAADRTALRTHSLLNTPPASAPEPPQDKYLTYNKYSGPPLLSPALRLHNPAHNHQPQNEGHLHTNETEIWSECESEREGGAERRRQSKPINIDLSQPAHNLHNTFNKGRAGAGAGAGAGRLYSGGDSLLSTSPPSLVSSLLLDSTHSALVAPSPHTTPAPLATLPPGGAHSTPTSTASGNLSATKFASPYGGCEQEMSLASSMTLSILDEKDMNTSFLSHTTCPDNDSLIGSLPPSLAGSVNSSYIVSGARAEPEPALPADTAIMQDDRLLASRPRTSLYKNMLRLDHSKSPHKQNSPSYNSNNNIMSETINIYSNKTFDSNEDIEKENLDVTFKKDAPVTGKTSLNVTLDKQELNEIIQARQKLSMARKNLPGPDVSPNRTANVNWDSTNRMVNVNTVERDSPNRTVNVSRDSPTRTVNVSRDSPNRTVNVSRDSSNRTVNLSQDSPNRTVRMNGTVVEGERSPNRSQLVSRQVEQYESRLFPSNETITVGREGLRRDATFKRSPGQAGQGAAQAGQGAALVRQGTIDIDSATSQLLDAGNTTLRPEVCAVDSECAMTGSGESSDTATLSSGSPPALSAGHDHAPAPALHPAERNAIAQHIRLYSTASTPRPGDARAPPSLLHSNISPISAPSPPRRTPLHTPQHGSAKLPYAPGAGGGGGAGAGGGGGAGAGAGVVRRGGLPVSKLRQYSSHRDLSRLPGSGGGAVGGGGAVLARPLSAVLSAGGLAGAARGGGMLRRGLYGSNPVLSPTHSAQPSLQPSLLQRLPAERRDSYTIATTDCNGGADSGKKAAEAPRPALVRQGTETIRRPSTLHPPTDFRGAGVVQQSSAPRATPAPLSRYAHPGGAAAATRPSSAQVQSNGYAHPARIRSHAPAPKPVPAMPAGVCKEVGSGARSSSAGADSRVPRPSRLPAPRRTLRPPSVYSVAPSSDQGDHY